MCNVGDRVMTVVMTVPDKFRLCAVRGKKNLLERGPEKVERGRRRVGES